MKRILFFTFMLAASNALWSQYREFSDLDSLKKVVGNAQTKPRERIDALSRISKTYMLLQDSVNSRKFMRQARALSAKEGGKFAIFVHSQQLQCLMLAPQINPKAMYAEIDTLKLLIDKTGDNEMKAMGCYSIGAVKFILNDNSAPQDGYNGLSFAQKLDDSHPQKFSIMFELYKLLYASTAEQKYSDEMLKCALKSGDKNQTALAYQKIASSFMQKFEENPETAAFADSAFVYLNKAREIIEQNPNNTLCGIYNAVMRTYIRMLLFDAPSPQNVSKAKQLLAEYEQTIKNKTFLDSESQLLDLYFWVYMQAEDYANAEKTVLRQIGLYEKMNYQQARTMENLYYNLYEIYRQTGEPEKALDALSECLNWNQVSFNTEKTVITETAAAKYGLEKKEQELKTAEMRNRLFVIIAAISMLLLISLLLIYRYRQRLKNAEMQQKLTAKEQESEYAKKITLASEIQVGQKQKTLEKIYQKLSKESSPQEIKRLIRMENQLGKPITDFKTFFAQLSPDFLNRLKQQAQPNELSMLNLKYVACILMQMKNKEIADTLESNENTVKAMKKRLKEKLLLPKEANLDEFLQKLNIATDN